MFQSQLSVSDRNRNPSFRQGSSSLLPPVSTARSPSTISTRISTFFRGGIGLTTGTAASAKVHNSSDGNCSTVTAVGVEAGATTASTLVSSAVMSSQRKIDSSFRTLTAVPEFEDIKGVVDDDDDDDDEQDFTGHAIILHEPSHHVESKAIVGDEKVSDANIDSNMVMDFNRDKQHDHGADKEPFPLSAKMMTESVVATAPLASNNGNYPTNAIEYFHSLTVHPSEEEPSVCQFDVFSSANEQQHCHQSDSSEPTGENYSLFATLANTSHQQDDADADTDRDAIIDSELLTELSSHPRSGRPVLKPLTSSLNADVEDIVQFQYMVTLPNSSTVPSASVVSALVPYSNLLNVNSSNNNNQTDTDTIAISINKMNSKRPRMSLY